MDNRPRLRTDRLELVPYEANDLQWLHQTFTDPFVRRYLFDDRIIPVEQVEIILDNVLETFQNYGWGQWKIKLKHNGEPAGFAGLWNFFDEPQPQLLYGLLPDYTKNGYGSEAANAITSYAFDVLNFSYLIASFDKPNTNSRIVCERLGMQFVEEKLMDGKPTVFYRIDRVIS